MGGIRTKKDVYEYAALISRQTNERKVECINKVALIFKLSIESNNLIINGSLKFDINKIKGIFYCFEEFLFLTNNNEFIQLKYDYDLNKYKLNPIIIYVTKLKLQFNSIKYEAEDIIESLQIKIKRIFK